MGDETVDVFISYGHQDAAWVHTLAENLHRAGLDVFLDKWEIGPGDVVVHELERGLRSARNGVLVVSPASVRRPWVQEEYAVMVGRAVEGKQRLIPVLLGDVELPPFAAARVWVDFRGADGPQYEQRVAQLVAALKDERPPRPDRDGATVWPSGSGLRPEGAHRATLRVRPDETVLDLEGGQVAGRPVGPSHRLEQQVWQLQRARRRGAQSEPLRTTSQAPAAGTTVHRQLVELGMGLAQAFLVDPVRGQLVEQIRLADDQGVALRLAVEVTEPAWVDLPWEALCLPEVTAGPLALHPRVELYRAVSGLGATTAIQIPGPLRILVVIGSPDQGDHGELLDYEAELKRILDAVEPARRDDRAYVRILNRGTAAEIRAALQSQRFHVLHISCHAQPGVLLLEKEDGQPDLMSADRFAKELLIPSRGVPLVVLAGCSTALAHRAAATQDETSDVQGEEVEQGEAVLPGLARQLLGHGVPAVLAMSAPVTDRYATQLGAQLYQELATQQRPDPLAAVAEARRQVDAQLRGAPAGSREARLAERAEWATPVLSVRGPSLPLFDPDQTFEKLQAPPEPQLDPRVVIRGVGDFVGRRREERVLLEALRGRRAGVVLHGIGGVGKSTLAAQLISDLGEQAGLVVSVAGKVTVDQVLDMAGLRVLDLCLALKVDEGDPLRQLAQLLRSPKVVWTDRLHLLDTHLLRRRPVLLLLDNFEDNLPPAGDVDRDFEVEDSDLAAFLAAWIRTRGTSRLLITSRYPFTLPDGAHRRLEAHHLGPLSLAETRKLVWRLPGLDILKPDQFERAYVDVGGHPRALEYLDALLRGGQARFDDVADRLEDALASQDIVDPRSWLIEVGGNLDRALGETITLAVNDVLLGELLQRLDAAPLARRLLLGVSVYRVPVDEHAVAWQVAEEITQPADPQREQRLREFVSAVRAAQDAGREVTAEQLELSEVEFTDLARELTQDPHPPLMLPAGLPDALSVLAELGLVAPGDPGDPTDGSTRPMWAVHRWTAAALARLAANPDLVEAHRRAARYWRWRVEFWRQDSRADLANLLEARYHHQAAGDLDLAVEVTEWVCARLHTWGAWSWEEQLCREALGSVPGSSSEAATFTNRLGTIAELRGNYDQALEWFHESLAIKDELGDRAGMASTYTYVANVAARRANYGQALDWYRQALAIREELGDRPGMAHSYHGLGIVASERGDYDQALDWYRQALAIHEDVGNRTGMAALRYQLGNLALVRSRYDQALNWYRQALTVFQELNHRSNMASCYHQLGMVAQNRGDHDQALEWYRQALTIFEELGNRSGMASSYHQLGIVSHDRGDYDQALEWYRQALTIEEELGDRSGMAGCYHQLGIVSQNRGDYDQALEWYRQALTIFEELGDRSGMARSYHQLGMVAQNRGDYDQALEWYRQALTIEEELGDRSGMANTYGQLGILAQDRGDYDQALDYSRQALTIFEEFGNRAGMAAAISQIGILLTETGSPEAGLAWNLRSLRIRAELQLANLSTDLHWMQRQRELLGAQRFEELLKQELGDQDSQTIKKWLQQLPATR